MENEKDFEITIPMNELIEPRAGNINSISWGGRYGGSSNSNFNMRLGIAWSSVAKSGYSEVTARLWVESAAIRTYGVAKSYALTINGISTSGSSTFNMGDWTSTFTHKLLEYTVNVTHTNATSITISGSFAINITYSGVYVGTMSHSTSASLPAILTAPSTPTWCNHTGWFENGDKTTVTWGGASGTITNYTVDVRFWDKAENTYGGWFTVGTTSSTSFDIGHGGVSHDALQARVRANNSAGSSDWREGGWVYHQGVKVNNNGFRHGIVKVWNGSSWVQGYVKVWNGSSWVIGK